MPPPIPPHFQLAKKRMRQGLHPAVVAAAERAMRGAPHAGARTQVYAGEGVNPGRVRPVIGGDARSAINPLAGQRYKSYLQRDPEGGLRMVHVYGSGENRQVRAFTPTKVAPSLMQQLSNTATAHDKLLAIAVRKAAGGAAPPNPRKKRVFGYRGGGLSRDV